MNKMYQMFFTGFLIICSQKINTFEALRTGIEACKNDIRAMTHGVVPQAFPDAFFQATIISASVAPYISNTDQSCTSSWTHRLAYGICLGIMGGIAQALLTVRTPMYIYNAAADCIEDIEKQINHDIETNHALTLQKIKELQQLLEVHIKRCGYTNSYVQKIPYKSVEAIQLSLLFPLLLDRLILLYKKMSFFMASYDCA